MNVEELMYEGYRLLANIEPNDCIEIQGRPSRLEIRLENRNITLSTFLLKNTQILAIDHFSSKEANDKLIKDSGMPEDFPGYANYKKLYLELNRFWGLIKYASKSVGIACRTTIYNGLPNIVTPEEFAKDPDGTLEKAAKEMVKFRDHPEKLLVEPQVYQKAYIALHKDFLKNHPVRKMPLYSQLLGIKFPSRRR